MNRSAIRSRAVGIALTCALLGGCAGDGSPETKSGDLNVVSSDDSAPSQPGSVGSFDQDTVAFMKNGIHQFSAKDPAWEATRGQWLALGERESRFLVHVMFAGLLAAQRMARPDMIEQARLELVAIGPPAVDMLGDMVAGGDLYVVYDEVNEEEKTVSVDDQARREAADILSLIGEPALPKLSWAFDNSETKGGRRFALHAIGNMGTRSGELGERALARAARDADWVLRVEAVQGMRLCDGRTSYGALVSALTDEEALVREKAAAALLEREETGAISAIQAASSAAHQQGRVIEAGTMQRVAEKLQLMQR